MTRNTDPVPDTSNEAPPVPATGHVDSSTEQVLVRRSPRYLRLIVLGAGLGAAGAFFAAVLREPAEGYSQAQVFGFLLIFGIVFGGALGIVVALILDRWANRGQRTLVANKLTVRAEESQPTDARRDAPAIEAVSAVTRPADTKPADTKPADTKPAETEPGRSAG
ncbi:hypothetical protein [Homoserinimonas sp. OAct 916]|uniref:hypothetical protein n=1 Tax=Homoserinimonas sp. OAct 916 TaxID=2211450 RepID=UPI001E57B0A3|nr:hypothetical protein [Homoserinimonas sp. OAct 916]